MAQIILDEGAAAATPATGKTAVYVKTDGKVYAKDDAGTEYDLTGGSVATDVIWDAKGDLAVGTGANTAAALTVGANGLVLTADSAEATGLKWAAVGVGDFLANGSVPMTGVLKEKKGADITAAATVDLGTATGNTVDVTHSTGTTAITSLGGASLQAGTEIETCYVISGGTLTLTHHATNLYLAGGANITLANGDVIRWRKMHSSNAEWKMVGGVKADGTAWVATAGKVVQVVEGTPYTTHTNGAYVIPYDDTIPQNTEGGEFLTVTITPTSASNRLVIDCTFNGTPATAATVAIALFQDSTANALRASGSNFGASYHQFLSLHHEMAAGTTSATTFKIRAGTHTGGTLAVNGTGANRVFGGVNACTLTVREIKV